VRAFLSSIDTDEVQNDDKNRRSPGRRLPAVGG
jgi:hypothetical protein